MNTLLVAFSRYMKTPNVHLHYFMRGEKVLLAIFL